MAKEKMESDFFSKLIANLPEEEKNRLNKKINEEYDEEKGIYLKYEKEGREAREREEAGIEMIRVKVNCAKECATIFKHGPKVDASDLFFSDKDFPRSNTEKSNKNNDGGKQEI